MIPVPEIPAHVDRLPPLSTGATRLRGLLRDGRPVAPEVEEALRPDPSPAGEGLEAVKGLAQALQAGREDPS